MHKQPIGLFDSGIGGFTIWSAVNSLLPNEDTIYLADSKNAPYGVKSKNEIIALSIKNTEYLIQKGAKIIVVACNTATTNAIKELRNLYDIPFIGIEPAIKPAAKNSQTQKIGILATKGTLSSELFHQTVANYKNTTIIEQIGYNLVQMIENGDLNSGEMKQLLQSYINPMLEADIDYLVLGCTHYPLLLPIIKEIVPKHVKIIDSGAAVAKQTKKVLEENNLLNTELNISNHQFLINKDPNVFQSILGKKYAATLQDF